MTDTAAPNRGDAQRRSQAGRSQADRPSNTDPETEPRSHAFITTDPRGRILTWGPGAEALYGWPAADAVGTPLADVIGGHERRALQAIHRAAARKGSWQGMIWTTAKNGDCRRVEVHAIGVAADHGATTAVMTAHIDRTRIEHDRASLAEAQFKAGLLDHIDSIVIACDARNRVIYWNDAAAASSGYQADHVLGRPIEQLLPNIDKGEIRRLRGRLKLGEVLRSDAPVANPDGRLVIINSITAPIVHPDGTYQGWVSVGHDVTAQRMADVRLNAAVAAAPFGIIVTDAQMAAQYANEAAARIAGLPRESLIGYGWVPALHPDDRDRIRQSALEAIEARRPIRVVGRTLHPDGSAHRFAAEIIPTQLGPAIVGCAVVVFEVPDYSAGSLSDATRARILDEISNAIVVTGLDGVVRYWNAAAERRFGWPAGEVIGYRTAEFGIVPDPGTVEAMTRGLMREGRWVGEVNHRRRDGTMSEAYVTTTLVLDADGRPDSIVSISADLDPIKDRQTALELQSQAIASIDAGMWLLDPATNRMEFVNAAYRRMLGLDLDDVRARAWAWVDRVHPDDRARVRSAVEASPVGADIEYRIEETPGDPTSWRHVHARTAAVKDASDEVLWVAGIVTDVTSLRVAQSELALMTAAIGQTRDGVLILDAEWRAVYVNDGFERLTGLRRDDLLGRHPAELVGGAGAPRQEFAQAMAATQRGETFNGAFAVARADGSPIEVDLSVWPISGADGGVSSIVTILRERTPSAAAVAALDRQVRERNLLSAALARIDAGGTLEETAVAVITPALELERVDVASVMAFVNGTLVIPVAVVGPHGIPIEPGRPLAPAQAARIRQLGGRGTTVEPWALREVDGDDGRRWTELGLSAVAFLPLELDGEVVGVLAAGSIGHEVDGSLDDHLPALGEHANMAMALLGPQLRLMRRTEERRAHMAEIIAARRFGPVYQPIVDLGTRDVVGYEALTRFDDGEPPESRFMEADALGLGIELEEATLEMATAGAKTLPPGAWLSLNVSPALAAGARRLRRIVSRVNRPLILEITERTAVDDYPRTRRAVRALGDQVRLAVDDAGAGFASLRHIAELRPDYVKLDMGLVRRIDRDPARQALVAGMVHYALQAGCTLIGEGIETESERRVLRRLGVGFGQGYLLGRPARAGAVGQGIGRA